MSCFELVATVLDEHWAKIPGDEAAKIKRITECQSYLHKQYSDLTRVTSPLDYSDPAMRYAYIRCYVTSHANLVNTLIEMNSELRKLFNRPSVKVTCIGGGPGSDLIGILLHIDDKEPPPQLKVYLYDAEKAWSDSWSDVDEKLGKPISTFFEQFDVTDSDSYAHSAKYLKSDLFTMIYFASEIHHCRAEAEAFFESIFANAKPGSLFLYIDNAHSHFYGWFDALYQAAGLDVIDKRDDVTFGLPYYEEKTDLGVHYTRIKTSPKLQARIAYRLLRKPM